ncbi:hypothetical protein SAFG77S_00216 [Streptomyces afghaniensis]
MIRGSALDTTVPARMATNMPAISPDMAWSICRLDMADGDASTGAAEEFTSSLSRKGPGRTRVPER